MPLTGLHFKAGLPITLGWKRLSDRNTYYVPSSYITELIGAVKCFALETVPMDQSYKTIFCCKMKHPLEKSVRNKHSSLLGSFVSYEGNGVL